MIDSSGEPGINDPSGRVKGGEKIEADLQCEQVGKQRETKRYRET